MVWWSNPHVEWANTGQFYMPPREPSAVRPPACKLLGFPVLSNDNSRTQRIALSTVYPWYSLNTALQSTAPYKITKRAKTKHRYNNQIRDIIIKMSVHSPLYACSFTHELRFKSSGTSLRTLLVANMQHSCRNGFWQWCRLRLDTNGSNLNHWRQVSIDNSHLHKWKSWLEILLNEFLGR